MSAIILRETTLVGLAEHGYSWISARSPSEGLHRTRAVKLPLFAHDGLRGLTPTTRALAKTLLEFG